MREKSHPDDGHSAGSITTLGYPIMPGRGTHPLQFKAYRLDKAMCSKRLATGDVNTRTSVCITGSVEGVCVKHES
jgi:hypothetical protein